MIFFPLLSNLVITQLHHTKYPLVNEETHFTSFHRLLTPARVYLPCNTQYPQLQPSLPVLFDLIAQICGHTGKVVWGAVILITSTSWMFKAQSCALVWKERVSEDELVNTQAQRGCFYQSLQNRSHALAPRTIPGTQGLRGTSDRRSGARVTKAGK